ncbi:Uncharacterised protein [Citrobacter freundii]|nr:Uncharacterised protein [Citrobacter freundii]
MLKTLILDGKMAKKLANAINTTSLTFVKC